MSSVAEIIPATRSMIYLGMDVHKDSITIAVFPAGAKTSPLESADRSVFREYHALPAYKLQRREELDRQIEQLALTPALSAAV